MKMTRHEALTGTCVYIPQLAKGRKMHGSESETTIFESNRPYNELDDDTRTAVAVSKKSLVTYKSIYLFSTCTHVAVIFCKATSSSEGPCIYIWAYISTIVSPIL